jgi:hypothetical protein
MPVCPKFEPTIIILQVSSRKRILVSATAAEPAESGEAADESFRHERTADPHDRNDDHTMARSRCTLLAKRREEADQGTTPAMPSAR